MTTSQEGTTTTPNDIPHDMMIVSVPLLIRKWGGRKVTIAPDRPDAPSASQSADITLIKAIARAYRWQRLLEDGTYATMKELAAAEKISPSYVSRLLRLTLLSPGEVEKVFAAV